MKKSKGESFNVSVEANHPLSGIRTRAQARRLSTQPLPKNKEARTSPLKKSDKSPTKSSPKANLSAIDQSDSPSVQSSENKTQVKEKRFKSEKKYNDDNSPKLSVSPSKQRIFISSPTKIAPNISNNEMSELKNNRQNSVLEGMDLVIKEEDEQNLFVDVKDIKTLSTKKEKRKKLNLTRTPISDSLIDIDADVKEEVISDISNDVETGLGLKKMKKDVNNALPTNLKQVKLTKHTRLTELPSVAQLKDIPLCNEMSPSKSEIGGLSKDPVSSGKEKNLKKKAVIEDNSESDADSDAESRKEIMRSAEKRIIRNISTSESESRNVNSFKMSNISKDSTDSDSAPDDITFDASRKSAMDLLKHTVDSIKRDKQKKKEKRKERLELLRQQKEENLIRLKERKANLEDASCSSSEESTHEKNSLNNYGVCLLSKGKKTYFVEENVGKLTSSSKSIENNGNVSVGLSHNGGLKRLPSDLLENLPDKLPKKMKMSDGVNTEKMMLQGGKQDHPKSCGLKINRDIDFLPLESSSSTQFGVVTLNTQKLKTVSQQAADFRKNMLYGSRVQRVPAKTLIQNRHKKEVLQS